MRASLVATRKFLADYWTQFIEEVPEAEIAAKTLEFEASPQVAELRGKIAKQEQKVTEATPTPQRATQIDAEIKKVEAMIKKQEGLVAHSTEVIERHTKLLNEANSAVAKAKVELTKLQANKETFCTQRGLPPKVDPVFLKNNRFSPLTENTEAIAAMQLLSRLADEAEAAAKEEPEAGAATTVPADTVDDGSALFDELMEEILTTSTAEVTKMQQEAIKKDPKAIFDFGKELKASMTKASVKSAARTKLKVKKT